MKEKINPIAEMYRQWRNISDTVEELRGHDYLDYSTPLRVMAEVLESRVKECVATMRKVADILESEGENNGTEE